jgi:hypothetical protein
MSARRAAAALCFGGSEDEDVNASSDYFRMLRAGVLAGHTAGGWRAFRAGYAATSRYLGETGGGSGVRAPSLST